MAKMKETGGKYNLGHASQNHGKAIGVPTKVLDNMNKSGSGEHAKQTHGHGIGVPTHPVDWPKAAKGSTRNLNGGGIFPCRGNVLRNSGVKGAHRLGCKK